MEQSRFRFSTRMRVRWAEVDAQGIVFNAHYLTYFDAASSDYYRAIGIPYPEALTELGGDLFVRKSTIEYHGSARYDDVLDVGMRCAAIGRTSITLAWMIARSGVALVTGETVYVFADPVARAKRAVPDALRDAFTRYDAGDQTLRLITADFATVQDAARTVRAKVFVEERGVSVDDEWDEDDSTAVHAVAYGPLGHPLATGRLVRHAPGVGRVGRMAVVHAMRGMGLGRRVLDVLVEAARQRGDRALVLHAMLDVVPFYARAGFVPEGAPYEEVGIPHRTMTRVL